MLGRAKIARNAPLDGGLFTQQEAANLRAALNVGDNLLLRLPSAATRAVTGLTGATGDIAGNAAVGVGNMYQGSVASQTGTQPQFRGYSPVRNPVAGAFVKPAMAPQLSAPALNPQPQFGTYSPASLGLISAPQVPASRPSAPRRVVGVVESGPGFTVLKYSDGSVERREGDRGTRNNNPGNLTGTDKGVQKFGAVGRDYDGNFVFSTPELGGRAMQQLVLSENKDKTVSEMLKTYAPAGASNDPNDTNKTYPAQLAAQGINLSKRIGDMSATEQSQLIAAMAAVEGGGQPMTAMPVQAGKAETEELGLMAQAGATMQAADQAQARVRSGQAVPLTPEERKRFGPENLGLIAFGLSLLGGEDITTAMNNGMSVYGVLDGMRGDAEQQKEIDAFIDSQPPEIQEFMRARLAAGGQESFAELMDSMMAGDGAQPNQMASYAQGLAEQGLLTPEDVNEVAVLQGLDPEKALELLSEKRTQAVEARTHDEKYLRLAQETAEVMNADLDQAIQLTEAILSDGIPGDVLLTQLSAQAGMGSRGAQLEQALTGLQAKIGFEALQQMRNNSPTGGALGNVSNQEIKFLQSMSVGGNLAFKGGLDNMLRKLYAIRENRSRMLANLQSSYANRWEGGAANMQSPTAQAAPQSFTMPSGAEVEEIFD